MAEKQDKLSGITQILQVIARSFNAEGCILWEVRPGREPIQKRELFPLAEYFEGEWPVGGQHLGMSSRTGTAILEGAPQWANAKDFDGIKEALPEAAGAYLEARNVQAACSVAFNLRGGVDAALNLYRSNPRPFRKQDAHYLSEVASRVPYLYHSLVDRVGLESLNSVTQLIRSAGPVPDELADESARKTFLDVLNRIVELVAATFDSLECSIYLEDPLLEPGSYRLEATKWPWIGHRQPQTYRKGYGLTGYCIEHQIPVRIFDLGRYDEDLAFVNEQYPGIKWSDPIDLRRCATELLKPKGELPPLSFMCAPIILDSRSLGSLRCAVTRTGPYYFDDRQVRFLCMVADQVAEWWGGYLSIRKARIESSRWRKLVEGVSRLNSLVHDELKKREPSEPRIFQDALRIAAEVNPQAEILSVRLVDEATRALYYAATHGERWQQGSPKEIAERKDHRYPLSGGSAGAHVIQTKKLLHEPDAQQSRFKGELFPDVRAKIVAPVSSGEKIFGVLDVRATQPGSFPPYAELVSELLARQLGLYHFLALKIQELNKSQTTLEKSLQTQQRIYEDFQHQMKTPVMMALQLAQSAARGFRSGRLGASDLAVLRGVCRKADRVSKNMAVFAALASGEPLKVKWKVVRYEEAVRSLSDSAEDHAIMVPPERELRLTTDDESLRVLQTTSVFADHDLLEQALSNLLDNAGKYSYPRTKITLKGGLTRRDGQTYFYIGVVNKGFEIGAAERPKLVERGFRGSKAQLATGEGAGIGLWIVDQIMRAHGGFLDIILTSDRGLNEFRLLFRLGVPKDLQ